MMAPITPQISVAYTQCKRKAFFLLHGQHAGKHNEYIAILEKHAAEHRDRYIYGITESHPHLLPYSRNALARGSAIFTDGECSHNDR